MRRMITIGMAAALSAFALPAAASAHHSSRAHNERTHHHRRHHRAHTVVFAPRHTTPAPTSGETPPGEGETAGTIASFEGGVLKITLSDGETVSGKVTERTEIRCGCAGHDGQWGEGGDDHSWSSGDHGDFSGRDDGDDDDAPAPTGTEGTPSCGIASLVVGAKVTEAELSVSGAGAVWEKVDLAHS